MATEAEAREQLAAALGTETFELRRRERRWLALGDELVAFAADDEAGRDRLGRERWLFERWRAAGIPAPRVVSDLGHVQVRERLAGITGDGIEPMIFGGTPPADRYAADTPIS